MESINKIQTKDYIANIIKKEILFNRMEDGEELVQETVANSLGVSRMPIREAFQILELEGFVERLPNRHIVVRGVTRKSIHEIFSFIEHMQSGFIKELFLSDKDHIAEFQKLLNEYKKNKISEIKLHSFFSKALDNLYINLLHEKLLNGYVIFVLEDLGLSGTKEIDIWNEVESTIQAKDEEKLCELFHDYFTQLANKMIKEVIEDKHA